jgi:hypothetical protein
MRVLVACEFSGIVRDAFIARGHYAMSCDLLPTEKPGPHYQGDVRDVLGDGWHMMVCYPPCTHSGPNRWKERSRTFEGVAEAMADQWGDYIAKMAAA